MNLVITECVAVRHSNRLAAIVNIHIFITGDNVLTAVSVSRQCGLVPAGEQLVFANAYLPEEDKPARISWELSTDDYVENNRVIGEEWPIGDVSMHYLILFACSYLLLNYFFYYK